MNLVDPAPPRAPIAPEDEMARGDAALPTVLDPQLLAAISTLWDAHAAAVKTAELDENGVVILRDAAGAMTGMCSQQVYQALLSAPARSSKAWISGEAARERRLERSRRDDADEVLSGAAATGPIVAGD